ncbi:MAG: YhdP family protein [Pseudomonadota bacterium]
MRRGIRQVRAWLLSLLAVVIIATAILVGVGRALIPYADHLRPWLTAQLTERLGDEVAIGRLEAQWPRLTPQLSLFDVRVGPAESPLLHIDQARLELHLPNLLDEDRNPLELIVLGLQLILEEDQDGRWGVRVEGGGRITDPSSDQDDDGQPQLFSDLAIRDAQLNVLTRDGLEFATRLAEGEVRRRGQDTLIRGVLEPAEISGNALQFSLLLGADEGRWQAGQAWFAGEALTISQWLNAPGVPPEATISMEAWGDWTEAEGGRIDMDLSASGLEGVEGELSAEVLVHRENRITQIDLLNLTRDGAGTDPIIERLAVARQGEEWAASLDAPDLSPLPALIAPWFGELAAWPSRVSGRIEGLEAGWRMGAGLTRLSGRLSDVNWEVAPRFPSVSNLNVELGLDGDRPVVTPLVTPQGQPQVVWESLFKEPIDVLEATGRALLSWRAIELQGLFLDTGVVQGTTDGWFYFDRRKPFMDLLIDVDRVGPVDPRRFLPLRFIPPRTSEWLNRSFRWVEDASGFVLLHMRAGTKTRQFRRGYFESEATMIGVDIDYQDNWPAASNLSGEATFISREVYARIDDGELGELPIESADLVIEDLVEPIANLTIRSGDHEAADVQSLLARIPAEAWQRSLEPMAWAGPIDITTRLRLPLKRMSEWWLEGEAELGGADLTVSAADLRFQGLRGEVGFDRQALGPTTLALNDGLEDRQPGQLNVVASFNESAWVEVDGRLNPLDLLLVPGALEGRLNGQADVSARMAEHPDGGLAVTLNSDLTGLAVNLPTPLDKPRELAWPSRLDFRLDDPLQSGTFAIADVLNVRAERAVDTWRVGVRLDDQPAELPDAGLQVRGELARLDISEWQSVLADDMAGVEGDVADELQADMEFAVGELILAGVRLNDVAMQLGRDESAWRASFDGPDVAGELVIPIPLDSGRVVAVDLQRLRFDPIESDGDRTLLDEQALSTQTSTESPIGYPPLHVLIEDLRWGELDLGRARLESFPSAEGLEVELIDVSGPDLRLNGVGRWVLRDDRLESQFSGRLTTGSVSGLLESAGYQSPLVAERTQLEVDLRWPGAPADFQLGRLSGVLDLQIANGTIPEARPGAGRLLGLGSLAALPRRLSLDFRDVFEAGLAFDQIEGRFDLASGFARTDALTVYSPAALITISGDTDMAARQYDQVVRGEPGLGGTLPVIGVLAGGPVGAAAGLVLQGILDRPMRGLAEARYTVTGPWTEPQMELVGARASDVDEESDGAESRRSDPEPPPD